MNILFQLSGSIACYKACTVVSQLVQAGHAVQCVASGSAMQFIGPATLEGLSQRDLLTDTFQPGRWMEHIELPLFVVPAMNTKMWQHPITQASVTKLQALGVRMLNPASGNLACGDVGDGRLMEPEDILKAILA